MDKKQMSSVALVVLAIVFLGASVASSKIKTLKRIKAGSITNPYIADNAVNSSKIEDGTIAGSDLSGSIEINTSGNIETTGSGTITSAGAMRAANGFSAGGVVNLAPADIVRLPTVILGTSCTEDGAVGVYPAGSAGQRILVCDGAHWIAN